MFSWRLKWQTTSYNGKRQPFNVFTDLLIATARWRWSYDRYRSTPFALDLALDKLVRSIARSRSQKNERSLNRSRSNNRSRQLCRAAPVCRSAYRDAHSRGSVSKLSMCWVVFNHSNNKAINDLRYRSIRHQISIWPFYFLTEKKDRLIFSVMVFLKGDSNKNYSPEILLVRLDWVTEWSHFVSTTKKNSVLCFISRNGLLVPFSDKWTVNT